MNFVRCGMVAVRRGWRHYSNAMDNHGWRAQAVNTGVLMATGDVIAQLLLERRRIGKRRGEKEASNDNDYNDDEEDYDALRTLRFFAGGAAVFGPIMHVWYSSLDRFVRVAKTPLRLAVCKMLCDQLMFMPMYLMGYISLFAALEGNKPRQIRENLEKDYGKLLAFSYKLWPAVQVANFYFVPLHHRIFVINTVGLIYYTYIDWTIEQTSHEQTNHMRTAYCKPGEESREEEAEEEEEEEDKEEK